MSDQFKITEYRYNTPVGSFEAKFDNIHQHHYPQLHPTNYGANLRTIDSTGRTVLNQPYDLQINYGRGTDK